MSVGSELAALKRVAREHDVEVEVMCDGGFVRSRVAAKGTKGGVFYGATALSGRGRDKAMVLALDMVRTHITEVIAEVIAERSGTHRPLCSVEVPS